MKVRRAQKSERKFDFRSSPTLPQLKVKVKELCWEIFLEISELDAAWNVHEKPKSTLL